MKSSWTEEKSAAFREWHERRLKELNYPPEVVKELSDARERWLPRNPK